MPDEHVPTRREPGRETDLRLARALGLKIYELEPGWWYYIPSGKPRRTHAIDQRPVPAYFTDPAAMLALLEGMRERGYSAQIYFDARKVTPAEARFVNEDDDRKRGIAHAATLMEAVAVAALAVLEGA